MYIDLPEYCFAYNAKVGISSFARAIITKYFPEHEPQVKRLLEENIENHHRHFYFNLVKKVTTAYKPVILLVREPVDRFLSAMNFLQMKNVEDALIALEEKSRIKIPSISKPIYLYQDVHFRKQVTYLSYENYLFRFPEHNQEAAKLIGLQEIPKLNSSREPKLKIDENQRQRILNFYRKDVQLYDEIKYPKTYICSKIKIEWDELFKKYFCNVSEITENSAQATKQFIEKYPYEKQFIMKYIVKNFKL